jgi:hypothetical protein
MPFVALVLLERPTHPPEAGRPRLDIAQRAGGSRRGRHRYGVLALLLVEHLGELRQDIFRITAARE